MKHHGRTIQMMLALFLSVLILAVPAKAHAAASAGQSDAAGEADVLNLLLIGQDKREGEKAKRSDSIIICSFHPVTKQLLMTSVLRDLYVPIPGYGKNRINAAYAYGGAALLAKTLERNLDIEIDGSIEVDFDGFAEILDILDGVTLELREDEAERINQKTGSNLTKGIQTLNGEQALVYSRIRNLDQDGDFSRTNRQRKVLQAVWDQYKGSSLPKLVRVMGNLVPLIETDMKSGELLGVVVDIFPVLSEISIVSHRIPQPGQCEDMVVDGMAVLVTDLEAERKTLHDKICNGG